VDRPTTPVKRVKDPLPSEPVGLGQGQPIRRPDERARGGDGP